MAGSSESGRAPSASAIAKGCSRLVGGPSHLVKAVQDDVQLSRAVKVLKDRAVESILHDLRHGVRGVETGIDGMRKVPGQAA